MSKVKVTEEMIEEFKRLADRPYALDGDVKQMIIAYGMDVQKAAESIRLADEKKRKAAVYQEKWKGDL